MKKQDVLQRIIAVMARRLFKNRHGDTQSFEWTNDRNIKWRGCRQMERIGVDTDTGEITLVDPPGGPCLVKTHTIDFPEEFAGYKIKGFIQEDDGYVIGVK